MATFGGANIVTDNLVLWLDAANRRSYPGSGTTWTDMSGNSNNGTLTNGPTFSSANNGSIVFDGVDDYIDIASSLTYKVPYPLSITAWFKLSSLPISRYTLVETDNPANSFHAGVNIGIVPTGFTITCGNNTQNNAPGRRTYTTSYNLIINQWYGVSFVLPDNLTAKSYINSTEIITPYINGTATTLAYSSSPMSIGYSIDVTPTNHINGNVASIQIYNRALSQAEVQQNYDALKSRYLNQY